MLKDKMEAAKAITTLLKYVWDKSNIDNRIISDVDYLLREVAKKLGLEKFLPNEILARK